MPIDANRAMRRLLTDRRFLVELHHLLWREPFNNAGKLDAGWMCREHALFVAGMGVLSGHRSTLSWGALSLIGEDKVGARSVLVLDDHSWAGVESFGFVDLSLNLERAPGTNWKKWPARYLLGTKFYPGQEVNYRQFVAAQEAQWQFEVQTAINSSGYHALYLGRSYEDLTAEFLGSAVKYIKGTSRNSLVFWRVRIFSQTR